MNDAPANSPDSAPRPAGRISSVYCVPGAHFCQVVAGFERTAVRRGEGDRR